jgi:hypothetical protein
MLQPNFVERGDRRDSVRLSECSFRSSAGVAVAVRPGSEVGVGRRTWRILPRHIRFEMVLFTLAAMTWSVPMARREDRVLEGKIILIIGLAAESAR